MSESEKSKFNPDDEENKERENSGELIWGIGEPTVENHSGNLSCITDGCKLYNEPVNIFNVAIGVKEAPLSMQRPSKHLAMICQCPGCSRNFWFHIGNREADIYKKRYDGGGFEKVKPNK